LPIAQHGVDFAQRDAGVVAAVTALRARAESDQLRAAALFQEALALFPQDASSAAIADLLRELSLAQVPFLRFLSSLLCSLLSSRE